MEREIFERDNDTGIYYMEGRGFWSKLTSKLSGKTAKKLASTPAEKIVTKGSEKIGEKTGQLIGEKIYDKFSSTREKAESKGSEKIQEKPPINENKGEKIIELLQKENPQQKEDKYEYVKNVYRELL